MTGNLAHQTIFNQSCTYQHLIGDMLIKLNKLSEELKLTHSEYRVMASIIGLYNKGQGKAYPTIEYLTKVCCMGKQTVLKALNRLAMLGLIQIIKQPGIRNNYYIGDRLLTGIQIIPGGSIACNTAHDMNKQNKTNRIIHANKQINDDDFNKSNIVGWGPYPTTKNPEYKQVLDQLNNWSFTGAQFAIKRHGIEKIKSLIDQTKQINPSNPGAYLRSLLNLPGHNIPDQKIDTLKTPLNDGLISTNQNLAINEPRLSRQEIISNLIKEGKTEEAETLSKLWKLDISIIVKFY